MPIARFEMEDGRIARFEVPNGTSPEQAQSMMMEHFATQDAQHQFSMQPKAPVKPTDMQKIQGGVLGGIVQGARDQIDAAAQLLPHGLSALTSLGGIAPNRVSEFFGNEAKRVDKMNSQGEQDYEAARKMAGREGFDAARLAGNIVSPANAAIALKAPMTAVTTTGRVLQGGGIGAIGGLLTPVNDLQNGDSYFGKKAAQAGLGAVTGGIATPIMGSIGEAIARKLNQGNVNASMSGMKTDELISNALREVGQKMEDIPRQQMQGLRDQVASALQKGKKLDPAAMLRQADFEALKIPATGGQISRDATQFARERNLRGVSGVGEPLLNRFEVQNQELQKAVGSFGGFASSEQFQAGKSLSDALKKTDEGMRKNVGDMYAAARKSSGKELDVPLTGLAQDYAEVLRNFGDKVPSGVRNRMEELGLLTGTQKKVFSIEDSEGLLKVINQNAGNDPATNLALGELRNSVKNAILSADDQGGVFAKARTAAAERFSLQDAVPALKAASTGSVEPDDFVKRFVLNGKTEHVKGLANLLKQNDAQAYGEAKNQIGASLQRAAFGENTAGDKIFSPERYAKALRELGSEKLSAFYSPQELLDLKRISRVGAYINSMPTASPVNHSNTAGAVLSLAGRIPGVPAGATLINSARNAINNQRVVSQGLAAQAPINKTDLTPEQVSMMVKLLSVGGASSGGFAATPLR